MAHTVSRLPLAVLTFLEIALPTAGAVLALDTDRDRSPRDLLRGGPGNDTQDGGEGRDLLRGGGEGDDRLRTRDGEADVVNCGPGEDRALLDFADVIEDATAENPNGSCERVVRKVPRTRDAGSEDA